MTMKSPSSGLPHHVVVGVDGEVLRNFEVSLPGVVALALTKAEKNTPQVSPLSRVSAEFRELENLDPLLLENPRCFVMFPIQYPAVWEMYKKHEASFWTAEEIDLSQDGKDWDSLTDSERHFVKRILAFFATVGFGSLPVEPTVFR